mgnify:CR=1 FL=1|jgi:hypothetical protein
MIFRRNKPATPSDGKAPVLRGRESATGDENPLARRFHPEDEPDTIDLQQGAGFTDEPGTADLASRPAAEPAAEGQLDVIRVAPETGKFYVLPGTGDNATYLGDEPVLAPTELRPGDRIRVGRFELHLLRQGQE